MNVAGKMAQGFRARAALAEDLGLIPQIQMTAHTNL